MTAATPEQLAAAFSALRRPDWPETLEAALKYAPAAAALRLGAWRITQGHDISAPVLVHRPVIQRPEPPHWTPPLRRSGPSATDHKRAAAADRDD